MAKEPIHLLQPKQTFVSLENISRGSQTNRKFILAASICAVVKAKIIIIEYFIMHWPAHQHASRSHFEREIKENKCVWKLARQKFMARTFSMGRRPAPKKCFFRVRAAFEHFAPQWGGKRLGAWPVTWESAREFVANFLGIETMAPRTSTRASVPGSVICSRRLSLSTFYISPNLYYLFYLGVELRLEVTLAKGSIVIILLENIY